MKKTTTVTITFPSKRMAREFASKLVSGGMYLPGVATIWPEKRGEFELVVESEARND